VVGVFPDVAVVIRLVGAVLQEMDDEWRAGKRYFSLESMRKLYQADALATPVMTRPLRRLRNKYPKILVPEFETITGWASLSFLPLRCQPATKRDFFVHVG
jgi:hypothetical protein